LVLVLVAALHWGAVAYAWRYRNVPGGLPYMLVMLSAGTWAFTYGLPMGFPDLALAIVLNQFRFLFLSFMGPALLLMVVEHARQTAVRDRRVWALLMAVPAVTAVLALTMPWHTLLRYDFRYETILGIGGVACRDGAWYRVHMAYTNLLVIMAVGYALASTRGRPLLFRRQMRLLAVAPLTPAALNIAFQVGVWPAPALNLAPFALLLSGFLMAVALFRHRVFDLRPLATNLAVQQMQDAFVLVDSKGRLVELNDAAALMLGVSPEQVLGQPFHTLLAAWPEADALARRTDNSIQAEVPCCPETPEVAVFYDARVAGVTADDGTVLGRVFLFRDISDRKRAEQHLTQALARERELHQLKSTFVSLVSHEFRTPLAAMQGAADLLSTHFDAATPAIRQRSLQSIRNQIQRLTALIEQATTLNRLEAGQVPFSPRPVDARSLLRDWCAAAEATAGRTGDLQLDADALPNDKLRFDPFLAECIVTNIVDNALKYSPPGSPVQVRIEHDGKRLIIGISDQGIGIPHSLMPNLFLAFQRGANVGRVKGTGVGLFLAKRCADLHRGDVTVSRRDGGGASFTIVLPAPPVAKASP
jgi:PAS domain S-box-containing protein